MNLISNVAAPRSGVVCTSPPTTIPEEPARTSACDNRKVTVVVPLPHVVRAVVSTVTSAASNEAADVIVSDVDVNAALPSTNVWPSLSTSVSTRPPAEKKSET